MKKLSKLVLREHISPADLVSKKAQKAIMGGYGSGSFCCSSNTGAKCTIGDVSWMNFGICDQICQFYTVIITSGSC